MSSPLCRSSTFCTQTMSNVAPHRRWDIGFILCLLLLLLFKNKWNDAQTIAGDYFGFGGYTNSYTHLEFTKRTKRRKVKKKNQNAMRTMENSTLMAAQNGEKIAVDAKNEQKRTTWMQSLVGIFACLFYFTIRTMHLKRSATNVFIAFTWLWLAQCAQWQRIREYIRANCQEPNASISHVRI